MYLLPGTRVKFYSNTQGKFIYGTVCSELETEYFWGYNGIRDLYPENSIVIKFDNEGIAWTTRDLLISIDKQRSKPSWM